MLEIKVLTCVHQVMVTTLSRMMSPLTPQITCPSHLLPVQRACVQDRGDGAQKKEGNKPTVGSQVQTNKGRGEETCKEAGVRLDQWWKKRLEVRMGDDEMDEGFLPNKQPQSTCVYYNHI